MNELFRFVWILERKSSIQTVLFKLIEICTNHNTYKETKFFISVIILKINYLIHFFLSQLCFVCMFSLLVERQCFLMSRYLPPVQVGCTEIYIRLIRQSNLVLQATWKVIVAIFFIRFFFLFFLVWILNYFISCVVLIYFAITYTFVLAGSKKKKWKNCYSYIVCGIFGFNLYTKQQLVKTDFANK